MKQLQNTADLVNFLTGFIERDGIDEELMPDFTPRPLREIYCAYGAKMKSADLFRWQNSLHCPDQLHVEDGVVRFISENQGCDFFYFEPGPEYPLVFSDLRQYEEPPVYGIHPYPATFENVLMAHCLREVALWKMEEYDSVRESGVGLDPLFLYGSLDLGEPHHNFYVTDSGKLVMTER